MRITVITLFPEMFDGFLNTSIIGRSIARGLLTVDFVQIRDFCHDRYRHWDDTPFGGGPGMIMKCQPALDALDSVRTEDSRAVLMSASGHPYSQACAHRFSQEKHLILFCGHYEGVDERIAEHMDESVSVGDYVLTGGELPAMVIIDSVTRLLKGSIAEDSTSEESYENGLLEYPQYTQPADYHGELVPEVLISGDHEKIRLWKLKQSLKKTRELRPDLLQGRTFTKEEKKLLKQLDEEEESKEQDR